MGLTFNSSLFIVLEVNFSLFNLVNRHAEFSHQLISVTNVTSETAWSPQAQASTAWITSDSHIWTYLYPPL